MAYSAPSESYIVILHDYFRSSAAYRVRIALNLKGLAYEQRSVNLLNGDEYKAEYASINPQALVPSLQLADGTILTQSLAICEYLDQAYPDTPPLLNGDALQQAQTRAFCQAIACDIHPINNLRVLTYLTGELNVSEEAKLDWYRHWVTTGLAALEIQLEKSSKKIYCFGDTPGLADVCLIPQLFNARRFDIPLSDYPQLLRIDQACTILTAFADAHPSCQPDAPKAQS